MQAPATAAPQFVKKAFEPEHILNTALCQSPPGVSKTKKAIKFIKHVAVLSRFRNGMSEAGIHHITLIATNRNLEETKQWRIRTRRDTRLNILVLSSKKGDINNIDRIISLLVLSKNADKLPDIIIFCTHQKRLDDMTKLITVFNDSNINLSRIGVHQITCTAMFDEADQNIELIADFIGNLQPIIGEANYCVRDIHYITATPFREFWAKLASVGIKSLKNINTLLKANVGEDDEIHISHEQLMHEYRHIDDHTILHNFEQRCRRPVEYAQLVLKKIIDDRVAGERTGPLTVFAPAEIYVTTHDDMRNLFALARFHCAILNGSKKGFYTPMGVLTSFDEFNTKHGVTGEFKDTLVKWRELNPGIDLVITGFLNVQRGVTFCTKGFNFTDLIVSHYHLKNMASLIQLLGRANGGKEYVEIMNIWSPTEVIVKANEQITVINEILMEDPEEFTEADFRKQTVADLNTPAMRVPVIVQLTQEEYTGIGKKGKQHDEAAIKALIAQKNPGLAKELEGLVKDQITEPTVEGSIKRQIDGPVAGAETNTPKLVSLKKKNKTKNIFQIFMDKANSRLIVCRFYGASVAGSGEDSTSDEEDDE